MVRLRPYQEEAVQSVFDYFRTNGGNPIIGMPTGTGKSLVIGAFIMEACRAYPGTRILKLTHVKELITQNYEKLLDLWPTAPAGIYSAGLGRRDITAQILYAGIASIAKEAERVGHVDLIVIDECHLVSQKSETQYRAFIEALRGINPYLKVIGLTATYYRMGQGLLTDTGLFTDICYDRTKLAAFNQLVRMGYLAPLVAKRMDTFLDADGEGVKAQGGEYNLKELQEAVNRDGITLAALQEALYRGSDRDHWLVFTTGVEHTETVATMLEQLGEKATFVHSKMTSGERDRRIADFKAGKYRMMVNNNILTTGFDYPDIDHIVVLRPTCSTSLWVQMLGRGTRPAPGKRDCLVSDFARNSEKLGPINDPVLPQKKGRKKGGTAPVRCCETCGGYNHASARTCVYCGTEFPRDLKYAGVASTADVMANDEVLPKIEEMEVTRVVYSRHTKEGRPDAIRADYYCGLRRFTAYICLEHGGYATKKAIDWWRVHIGVDPLGPGARSKDEFVPGKTAHALEVIDSLPQPSKIFVWTNTKYPEVRSYVF